MFQNISRFIDPLMKTSPARKQQAKFLNLLQTFLEDFQQTKDNFRIFFELMKYVLLEIFLFWSCTFVFSMECVQVAWLFFKQLLYHPFKR